MIPLQVGTAPRPTAIRPSLRASSSNDYYGSLSTGVNLTIPGSTQVGDLILIGVATRGDTRTVSAPGDYTKIYDSRDWPKSSNGTGNNITASISIYMKWAVAGDASSTKNFKAAGGSGSEIILGAVGVYQGVSHIACKPRGTTHYGGSWQSSTPMFTSMSMGEGNLLVTFIGARSGLNQNADNCLLSSFDSDYTVRENRSRGALLVVPQGIVLADAPVHGWVEESDVAWRSGSDNNWTMVTLELAGPNAKGWFENERWPATLQDKPIYIYGTSNTNMIPRQNIRTGGGTYPNEPKWTTQNSWPDWLIEVGDPNHLGNHMGVGGSHAADNVTFALGTHVNPTRAVTADLIDDISMVRQAGTWMAQTNRAQGGIVFLDIFGNDILWEETPTAQVRDGVQISTDTMVRLMRAKAVYGHTASAFSYTGSWQNQSSDGAVNNLYARTLAAGAKVTVTTSEPLVDLLLIVDNGSMLQTGAPYSITVNGVLHSTGTTASRLKLGASSPTPTYNYVQMTVPLNLGVGNHTIEITHTGVNNESLRFQGAMVPETDPAKIPYVVLMGMQLIPDAGIVIGGQTAEALAAYLQIMRDVADQFPDNKVLVYDPNATGQWGRGDFIRDWGPVGWGGVFTNDMIHMNNVGHAFFAIDLMRFLNERIP